MRDAVHQLMLSVAPAIFNSQRNFDPTAWQHKGSKEQ
jgi:hypothetical protein